MDGDETMDVFISWSGDKSNKIAIALNEWLPSVIQSINPYVSSENILKGSRWNVDIAHSLENSGFGILCLTPDNLDAPWVLFEAGALSKKFGESNVAPVLIGVKRQDVKAPLSQFQSVIFEKDDFLKLVKTLNEVNTDQSLDEIRLNKIFNRFWPDLEGSLKVVEDEITSIAKKKSSKVPQEKKQEANLQSIQSTLEELVLNLRSNQRLLNDPEGVLPRDYLLSVLQEAGMTSRSRGSMRENRSAWEYLDDQLSRISIWFNKNGEQKTVGKSKITELQDLFSKVEEVSSYLSKSIQRH